METKLLYVELKTGYNDDGPAWIGFGVYNRTGKTLYFDGKIFGVARGSNGNHFHEGDEYWVSRVKKDGRDRRYGVGKIYIDEDAVSDYIKLRGIETLTKSIYTVVKLNKTIPKEYNNKIQNKPL